MSEISNKRTKSHFCDSKKIITSSGNKTPITQDGEMPKKKFYRSRAHCNPLAHNDHFDYPTHPDLMDWSIDHYPNFRPDSKVNSNEDRISPDILDIGCGFGGLTIALSTLFPEKLVLGIEIRAKVTEYVRLRIMASRRNSLEKAFENCSVLKSNTMKFMPNLFRKASLEKIFFCFPDPHFKRKNYPRRIVSENLLSEYAHFLKPGIGRLYTITDVEELHNWHIEKINKHPCFRELTKEELENDKCVNAMYNETEEGKKVERAGTKKYYAVYNIIENRGEVNAENFFNTNEFGVSFKVDKDEQL